MLQWVIRRGANDYRLTYSLAIRGAKKDNKKFQNQFVAEPNAMALGRTRRGNDSPR